MVNNSPSRPDRVSSTILNSVGHFPQLLYDLPGAHPRVVQFLASSPSCFVVIPLQLDTGVLWAINHSQPSEVDAWNRGSSVPIERLSQPLPVACPILCTRTSTVWTRGSYKIHWKAHFSSMLQKVRGKPGAFVLCRIVCHSNASEFVVPILLIRINQL